MLKLIGHYALADSAGRIVAIAGKIAVGPATDFDPVAAEKSARIFRGFKDQTEIRRREFRAWAMEESAANWASIGME